MQLQIRAEPSCFPSPAACASAVTASPCGPVCHLRRYRPHRSVSPLHPRPARSVCLSHLLFKSFCISHLLNATSPSVRPRGRPPGLGIHAACAAAKGKKKKMGKKQREGEEEKKKTVSCSRQTVDDIEDRYEEVKLTLQETE